MPSTSAKQQRPQSSCRDRGRRYRRGACSANRYLSRNRESACETEQFLAVFNTLASANQALLSSIDEVLASLCAPEAEPLLHEIANLAESIRTRMSLMERLAAELKDVSEQSTPSGADRFSTSPGVHS
jgi:hypothetical protein